MLPVPENPDLERVRHELRATGEKAQGANPLRSGPARALAMELRDVAPWGRFCAQAALWRSRLWAWNWHSPMVSPPIG